MVRSVLGVIGGVMAGFWVILGVIKLGNRFYPPPAFLDYEKPETIFEAIRTTPTGMLLFLVLAYAIGTFIGAGITARIAADAKVGHGMVVGGFFFFINFLQNVPMPYPLWFKFAGLAVFLPMAYLGAKLVTIAPTKKPDSLDDLADPEVA